MIAGLRELTCTSAAAPIYVAIISFSGMGHILPILQFAKLLTVASDRIRVNVFTQLAASDLPKVPSVLGERVELVLMADPEATTGTVTNSADFAAKEVSGANAEWIKLFHNERRIRPSIVVNGMLVCSGPAVAGYFKAHLWAFNASCLLSLTICALDHGRASDHQKSVQDIQLHTKPTDLIRVGGLPPFAHCACSSKVHRKKDYAYMCPVLGPIAYEDMPIMPPKTWDMHDMFARSFRIFVNEAEYILCNDVTAFNFPNAEGKVFTEDMIKAYVSDPVDGAWGARMMSRARNIGPLCALDSRVDGDKSERMIQWLNSQPPKSVVYVSLGSWGEVSSANLFRLAQGLELSGRPILWALRGKKPEPHQKDHRGEKRFHPLLPGVEDSVITDAMADELGLPIGWFERMGNRAYVAPWLNQIDILTHASLGCFVTHCGWNSLLEAFTYSEVPMVALPVGAEQAMNSRLIAEVFHNGVRLRKTLGDKVEPEAVAVSIETAMTRERFTLNAQRLHRLAFSQIGAGAEELQKILSLDGFPSI